MGQAELTRTTLGTPDMYQTHTVSAGPPSFTPSSPYLGSNYHESSEMSGYSLQAGSNYTPTSATFPSPATPISANNHGFQAVIGRPQASPNSAQFSTGYLGSPSRIKDNSVMLGSGTDQRASMLQLIEFYPMEGDEGTQVTVKLHAEFPPDSPTSDPTPVAAPSSKTLRILFGSSPVQTKVGPNSPQRLSNGGERYDGLTLYGAAPNATLTGCVPVGVSFGSAEQLERVSTPVYIQVLNPGGLVLENKLIGNFTFESSGSRRRNDGMSYSPAPSLTSPRPSALKRSGEPLYSDRASPSSTHLSATYNPRRDVSGPPIPGQSPGMTYEAGAMGDQSLYRHGRYATGMTVDGRNSPGIPMHDSRGDGYSTYNPSTASHPYGPGSSHATPPQPQPIQRQHSPHGSPNGPPGMPPVGQPSLMRTSQLSGAHQVFSPYVGGGNSKAVLEFAQDINLMAVGWNQEEWIARRRLVQFWRRQEGSTIHTAFRAISQAEYVPNSIVISCVYREDKNECFVTSVDAIYLLEALVGVRFSVEEKNRIRRNLEGFRPITVSKSKPGSEEFFKLIMGFPNPKPRNIEKDVKVFPWSIFGTALKKIIGKYSASYTLPANGNMGPPQPVQIDRAPSPPIAPYVIPAPLMPADGSMPQGAPYPVSNGNGHQPPYAYGDSSMQGMSSGSSSSLPTLGHMAPSPAPSVSGHSNGSHGLSRHASNGDMGGGDSGGSGGAVSYNSSGAVGYVRQSSQNPGHIDTSGVYR